MMRYRRLVMAFILLLPILPEVTQAAVPSLQLAPLKYQATLKPGSPQIGYITVSNPSDTSVTVHSEVQGMRQTGDDGSLQFYTSPSLAQGITVSADNVPIPAHGAVNFQILIDPDHLPQGGVYAAVFFQTVPQASGTGSRVLTSARVGSLLLLQNGDNGRRDGSVTKIALPWFVYTEELTPVLTYHNTGAVAQNPDLAVSEGGVAQIANGPYILPGASRSFEVAIKGSVAGPVRLSVLDHATGKTTTRWAFVVTGYWRWLLPIIILIVLIWYLRFRRRRKA